MPEQDSIVPRGFNVSDFDGILPAMNPQQESDRLSEGLKSCRNVLESYRLMLGGERDGDPIHAPPPFNDNQE